MSGNIWRQTQNFLPSKFRKYWKFARIRLQTGNTFLGKKFADQNNYEIDAEQEAYSIGLGNIIGPGSHNFCA